MPYRHNAVAQGSVRRRFRPASLLLLPAALAALTAPARAQINPSFELTPDYTGYTRIGATSIVTSTFGKAVPDGTRQAFLDNDTTNGSVPVLALETFLGVAPGSLSGLGQGNVVNGSAVQQTFTGGAGDTLSFMYDLLTTEDPTFPPFNNDFAFVRLSGPGIGGNGLALLRNVSAATTPTPFPAPPGSPTPNLSDYLTETGYLNFSSVLPAAGVYTLSFGVVSVDDVAPITGDIGSALLVDNIQRTTTPTVGAVPEPATGLLALLGAPVALALRRRRRAA